MKHILDAHLEKMGGKELSKLSVAALEHSLETATIRLAKRGLYEYAKKGVLDGALKAGGKYVAGKMAKKGAKEVVEAGAKQVAKTGAKKTFAGQTAKMTKGMVKSAVERAKGKFAINTMVRKGAAPEILSASIKRAGSLPSRLARPLFGKTDPITKLFALKSFSSVVQQGQANGLSPINSILRGTLAAGTTNAI